jgi:thioredoxin 1
MPLVRFDTSDTADWRTVLAKSPLAVVYKHSTTCGLCDIAMDEITRFVDGQPDVPVHLVDVLRQRPLSNAIEAGLGIRHESPQAIVLAHGEPVWHGSHRRVTAAHLVAALAAQLGA